MEKVGEGLKELRGMAASGGGPSMSAILSDNTRKGAPNPV